MEPIEVLKQLPQAYCKLLKSCRGPGGMINLSCRDMAGLSSKPIQPLPILPSSLAGPRRCLSRLQRDTTAAAMG